MKTRSQFLPHQTEYRRDSKELGPMKQPVRASRKGTPTEASGSGVLERKHTHLQKADGH